MFVAAVGSEGLTIVDALPYTDEAHRKDLAKILELLEKHFLADEKVLYERYRFYQRRQNVGEPVETFMADLRRLARTCDFT